MFDDSALARFAGGTSKGCTTSRGLGDCDGDGERLLGVGHGVPPHGVPML
jgi:hypothetical protein